MSEVPDPIPQPAPDADCEQDVAPASLETLSDAQRNAMKYLVAGNSISDAARFSQVTRRTLYRWLKDDPNLRSVYNAWRRELIESARTRLLTITNDAVDTIHGAIMEGSVSA